MQPFSIIITVCDQDFKHLPHCIQCLMNQTYKEFEVIVMVDGHELPYNVQEIIKHVNGKVIYTDKANDCGYTQRRMGLICANGEYLIWLNADNLVYPTFMQTHKDNIVYAIASDSMPPISVVNIHYWLKDHYWGVLPRELSCGNFDLLNYCLPKHVALECNAFEEYICNLGEEDFYTFNRAKKIAPVIWFKDQAPVGCHF